MLFTHTYPLFRKLMLVKEENERLSQALNIMYEPLTTPETGNFFEMGSSVAQALFLKNAETFTNELNKEIKDIFHSEMHFILQQDKRVKLIQITSNNYNYIFLSDSSKKVTILTTFYKAEENNKEHPLLTEYLEKPYYDNLYMQNTNYYIVNTYSSFCKYADYNKTELSKNLNYEFFNSAKSQIIQKQSQPNLIHFVEFDYITFQNVIILYKFEQKIRIIKE